MALLALSRFWRFPPVAGAATIVGIPEPINRAREDMR
jgi:hypothetical protein